MLLFLSLWNSLSLQLVSQKGILLHSSIQKKESISLPNRRALALNSDSEVPIIPNQLYMKGSCFEILYTPSSEGERSVASSKSL